MARIQVFPANIYQFKVINRNIRKRCEIFSKLTIKATERRYWRVYFIPFSNDSIVDFEQVNVSCVSSYFAFISLLVRFIWQAAKQEELVKYLRYCTLHQVKQETFTFSKSVNRSNRKKVWNCSKLTIKTPELTSYACNMVIRRSKSLSNSKAFYFSE